jgi:hypothetical protein
MPKNRDTWLRIAERENLDEKAFDYATWAFAGITHLSALINLPFSF